MGTRGYRIVRYRGRYWIYYNHYDSYPEHLGAGIVAGVPVDRKEYEGVLKAVWHIFTSEWSRILNLFHAVIVWLQQKRDTYERRLVELEEHFCITEERVRILKSEEGDAKSEPWANIRELEVLPSHFGDASNTVFIEWVYLIDLDEQVFSVNNRVFFRLWNIPRDTWITPFESWDLSTEKCPEASLEPLIPDYFADDAERDRYNEMYKRYQHSDLYEFSAGVDYNPRNVMALMLYEYLLHPSHSAMWDYVPQWGYTDFAFRELAFAILSLAASEFHLTDVQKLHGHYRHQSSSRGFLVQDDAHDRTEVLPILGAGCHTSVTKPGCAPLETTYYFQGILISLVTAEALFHERNAAIAKAVEVGLQSGNKEFEIILFSIKCMIVVKVSVEGDVTSVAHSGVLPVTNGGAAPFPPVAGTESALQAHPGFAILQIMFEQQVQKDLQQFSRGVFPPEIYAEILSYVDPCTELACSKVSPVFRSICQAQVTTPDGLVTKFETIDGEEDKPRSYHQLVPFGTFTFKDMKIATVAQPCRHFDDFPTAFNGPQWCAIIGTGERKCVIAQARIPIITTDLDEEQEEDSDD
ncbi:uncharacterized protein ARB_07249 [Trichophyton benhamiae CBS 112371]|uniref:F-box domain-containing protein n=1 Tax=Arthroderma benhamiae (strain ATCC MYA-4681 / CBS 112371) TaxID=663331 RepID=D4ASN4_ARTBC|nr:uncharacterized protein ARB_07249 [Trichophyton benhamiae CBS 112371]EFE33784.1 conserved hypothetical protein [Trichophyton benhamiae CBS 112371]